MIRVSRIVVPALIAIAGTTSLSAQAQTTQEILAAFGNQARSDMPSFSGFSSERGRQFFNTAQGRDLSCSSCHTKNPAAPGKHAETGKLIQPLAPAANAERFTDMKKVEKWFKRNCNDVLDRACTSQEKGDVISYLLTVKN